MKKFSVIFTAGAVICSIVLMMPASSYGKKRDQNCLNRCQADKRVCFKKARKNKYKERLAAENECRREHNTCVGLCPDAILE